MEAGVDGVWGMDWMGRSVGRSGVASSASSVPAPPLVTSLVLDSEPTAKTVAPISGRFHTLAGCILLWILAPGRIGD